MKLLQLNISPLKYQDFFTEITQFTKQHIVFTPNPEILLEARKDSRFKNTLQEAKYLTNDGIGLYIGYQVQDNSYGSIINLLLLPYYFCNIVFRRSMLYKKYGDRICGSDLTLDLLKHAEQNAIKIAIVDLYNPTDTWKVENQKVFWPKLQEVFPELNFDYHIYNPENITEIIDHISHSRSQILFSTLGMKTQEQSVVDIMKQCNNIKLGLGVGSSFDYITWFQKRAPKIMRVMWMEWLYRIFTSPGKIQRLKRIFSAVVVFPLVVLFDKSR